MTILMFMMMKYMVVCGFKAMTINPDRGTASSGHNGDYANDETWCWKWARLSMTHIIHIISTKGLMIHSLINHVGLMISKINYSRLSEEAHLAHLFLRRPFYICTGSTREYVRSLRFCSVGWCHGWSLETIYSVLGASSTLCNSPWQILKWTVTNKMAPDISKSSPPATRVVEPATRLAVGFVASHYDSSDLILGPETTLTTNTIILKYSCLYNQ